MIFCCRPLLFSARVQVHCCASSALSLEYRRHNSPWYQLVHYLDSWIRCVLCAIAHLSALECVICQSDKESRLPEISYWRSTLSRCLGDKIADLLEYFLGLRTCRMNSINHEKHEALKFWFRDLTTQAHIQTAPAPPISEVSARNPTKQLAGDLMLLIHA